MLPPHAAETIPVLPITNVLSPQLLPVLATGTPWWPRAAHSTEGESRTRAVGRYPVPNKKDMPYDIMELMEEVEIKVKELGRTLSVERVQVQSSSYTPGEQFWSRWV